MTKRCWPGVWLLCVAGVWLLTACPAPAFDDIIDSPMYRSPFLPTPRIITVFPKGVTDLWLRALERPDAELRIKAADAIARGHERGMPGLERTVGPLIQTLELPGQHAAVRLAVARALIALDARQSAGNLFTQLRSADIELRNLIEPALARWDHAAARAVWLERLAQSTTPARSLILAIQGLGTVGEARAVGRLRTLVHGSTTPAPIRLEAARALGAICTEGLVPDAEKLAADGTEPGIIARLAAANLLQRHRDPAAIALLQRLLRDREPAVTVLAAGRLFAIDAHLVVGSIMHLATHPDPAVRIVAVDTCCAMPSAAHVHMLSERLTDAHVDVRRKARRCLDRLARKTELRSQIIDDGMRVLAGADWRGQEQAAILLAELDHKPAAQRCVELLELPRPEAFVTAAWALRRLAVAETLAPVLEHVRKEFKHLSSKALVDQSQPLHEPIEHKLSQLNQLLGQQRHAAADPVLRQFIPKRASPGGEARGAAIWALGLLHEGKVDAPLAADLVARLEDRGIPPEDPRVRRMSAIALGRMKAAQALPGLRAYWSGRATGGFVSDACGWAIAQITGTAMPTPEPLRRVQRDWFLTPLGQ